MGRKCPAFKLGNFAFHKGCYIVLIGLLLVSGQLNANAAFPCQCLVCLQCFLCFLSQFVGVLKFIDRHLNIYQVLCI